MNPKPKTYTVRTSRRHIRQWRERPLKQSDPDFRCPIERFFDEHTKLHVSIGGAYFGVNGEDFPLPQRVKYWLARLDSGKPVRPITFKIKLPV